jgi:predicted nucleotidyltransferase
MCGLSAREIDIINSVLKGFPIVKEAVIFGSRAKGNYKPFSDVDIAIKGPHLGLVTAKIKGLLDDESPLPYTFDVVAFDELNNEALKEHILRVGVRIYP